MSTGWQDCTCTYVKLEGRRADMCCFMNKWISQEVLTDKGRNTTSNPGNVTVSSDVIVIGLSVQEISVYLSL